MGDEYQVRTATPMTAAQLGAIASAMVSPNGVPVAECSIQLRFGGRDYEKATIDQDVCIRMTSHEVYMVSYAGNYRALQDALVEAVRRAGIDAEMGEP